MRLTLFIILAFLSVQARAQTPAPSLESKILSQAEKEAGKQFFTFLMENDSIGGGTDQNYTSGVRLTYFNVGAEFPEIAHTIARHVPTFNLNATSSVYYSVGQNIYTPRAIESRDQDPDDRPWAAFLYSSIGMATVTDNHVDELEATLGVVGPLALGEQAQKAVHKHLTNSPRPRGWDNQLKNEPGLMLLWQRRWLQNLHYQADGLTLTAEPHIGISLGNIYTYGGTGLSFRLSPAHSRWDDSPGRVQPAMPGTGYFQEPAQRWDWYIFGGLEGRAIARNIFLDGNSFAESHSVDKFPLVADAHIGAALTFGPTRLSYTLVRRSREFKTQDSADIFGALSLSYRF